MTATATRLANSLTKGNGRMGRRRVEPDTAEYSRQIAARVRHLRERKGLSVAELADKLGVHEQTVYSYENGKRTIDPDLFPALFRALGCHRMSDFFPPLK